MVVKIFLQCLNIKIVEFIKKLKKYFHKCNFDKIIVSQYWTFNLRKVVVECKCGKRDIQKWHHDNVYPILTTNFITNEEMQKILNEKVAK